MLQPIVGARQQLIVGYVARNLQLMVVSRQKSKADFARRLHEVLNEIRECPPGNGRPGWLRARIDNVVSQEAVRKWLEAMSIPAQPIINILAVKLNVTAHWLQSGQLPKRPPGADPATANLHELWQVLDESGRYEVLRFARYRAGQPPEPPKPAKNGDGDPKRS